MSEPANTTDRGNDVQLRLTRDRPRLPGGDILVALGTELIFMFVANSFYSVPATTV